MVNSNFNVFALRCLMPNNFLLKCPIIPTFSNSNFLDKTFFLKQVFLLPNDSVFAVGQVNSGLFL